MRAIVAVDQNWGIGYQGNLLQRIPEDMRFFKDMTVNKVVVMGRETFDSLPGKEPLKDRTNIVLSRNKDFENPKVTICRSLEDLFKELDKQQNPEHVVVIGGESIYRQLLPFCVEAYVTKIEKTYLADKYFVNLDQDQDWVQVSTSEAKTYQDIEFRFIKYIKK